MASVEDWIEFLKGLLPPRPPFLPAPPWEVPKPPEVPVVPVVPAKPPTPVKKCQDPKDPDTWPPVPTGWRWNPTTEGWLAYKPGGLPLSHYEFVQWKYGMTHDEWDYLVFRYNVAAGKTKGYENSWGEAHTPTCTMPDQYCSPYYPDWYSGWRGYYTRNLTDAQVRKVEATDPKLVPESDELEDVVMDEIMMKHGVHNAKPLSRYYKKHWYIFYRHAGREYVRDYMDNPCPV